MNYKTAKKLKDAGFPQCSPNTVYLSPPNNLKCENGEWVYIPTLSELIAECGDDFISLEKHDDEFNAMGWWPKGTDTTTGYTDIKPEIALAYLWLALNEK